MDFFTYKNGRLHAEDIAVSDIAAKVGTPFYLYSEAALTQQFRRLTDALSPLPHQVFFAVKALSNIAILRLLGDLGAGMDVVSAGEYQRARAAGVPGKPDRVLWCRQDPTGNAHGPGRRCAPVQFGI